ncbi:NAD(P)H-quinone oxidoreductase subunit F [Planktothrix agardhii]|jgi:NAD(P)H-quinone oxidoreductase subunit 5|uniref:NdhF n=2 Tax=Planktothrix agardhii TaxID=1160 RepID=A0A073CE78_PLAA1|nr:NAD(P)H-quinone oxidoreductase subunit F [Planktothrix agardhii]MCF3607843.1 NAD(P)H-quinone oxidoreductase subunit F [Planktothrix agardhii 1033]BBD55166.1 NADH dehydrogenase subunit 5 [Planktothrix agardhii NIES-204]KEI66222.1 NdhF [Planktothrix agardhii NIVA-CYA 126/8]MBG0748467.1 NAD(P)H-quinone oxidoreductase subunit F [Planktothrix agardhii KL2]MCB8751922.1 NAD(P)H-quinone oxidoreductase subunit F [Planktothrix agardhii 1810]
MTDFLLHTSWWIPFYGLIGAILTLPWSAGLVRRTGPRPAAYFNLLMTVLALVHGSVVFRTTWDEPIQQIVFHWVHTNNLDLSFALEISPVSLGAIELITGLSLIAQCYALGYMEKDWALARFFGLMGFFEAAISGLALSDSLLLSYILLELLTLSTYLLVGFWYAQPLVVTAARDAFLTKRVGDVLLLMGVVYLSTLAGSLSFSDLEGWAETATLTPLHATLLGLALISGPIGKCAQFPLNLWLDEAMEGPNPASILRNSVVVASGAYVLIKLQPVLALSPIASTTLVVLGTITAIGASLVSIAQIDLKRALSHSTSAYLGLVFIAVGESQVDIALLLLFTHAIAKALVFMSAGSVILTTNTQNLTEMGGLWSKMPATTTAFIVGAAGLVALMPLGTFWTMRRWVNGFWTLPLWLILVLLLVNCLTALSLTRVFGLVFAGKPQQKTRRAPEVPWPMALPLVSMTILTLLVPLMLQQWQLLISWRAPLVVAPGTGFAEIVRQATVPLLVISGLLGVAIGGGIYLLGMGSKPYKLPWKGLQDLFAYDFYIDRIYGLTVVLFVRQISAFSAWIDRYIIDGIVNAFGLATLFSGEGLKYSISGQSQFYLLTIALGVGVLMGLMLWQF